ncbi:MAG: OmpH family outer membrane protein [Balneolales bacterium]|nr:OmpH family outer membrane protein [Balneolales bacterium]
MKYVFTKTVLFFAAASLIMFAAPSQSSAQELRIGIVDAGEILMQMPELTTISDQLDGFTNRKRREFAQLESEFVRAREEFEQKVAVISESARQAEQERLSQKALRLQQFQQEYQQELMQRQENLIAPLRQRILDSINEVAQEMGLAYVINRMVNNGDMVVLYASEEMMQNYDVTRRVKQKMGIRER